MGIYTYETEATSVIPPAKVFKAFVVDADYLFPKVVPHTIQSAQIIEGDGGPGTIKKITFAQGSKFDYVKQRVDTLDKEKFIYAYTIIEGDAIGEVMEKIEHEIKVNGSSDGGSILRSTSKYHTKNGIEIKEEQIKAGKEKGLGLFKLVEAHLLANERNDESKPVSFF